MKLSWIKQAFYKKGKRNQYHSNKTGYMQFPRRFSNRSARIFHVFSPFIIYICEHFRCFWEGHFGMIQIMVTWILMHLCKKTDEWATLDNASFVLLIHHDPNYLSNPDLTKQMHPIISSLPSWQFCVLIH